MAEIESMCARFAARRISEQELTARDSTHEAYRRKVRDRMQCSYSEHDQIIRAIRMGEHVVAAKAMRNQVIVQGN